MTVENCVALSSSVNGSVGVGRMVGENVTVGAGTTQASVFSGWDPAIWDISGNLTINALLPTLRNTPGTQNPRLP